MADIIVKYRFQHTQYSNKNLNAVEKNNIVNTADAFDYCDRDEACDKTMVSTEKAFNYADYRLGSAGSITNGGRPIDATRMQWMCDQYKPPVLYGMIISFDHDFAVKNQIIEKKNMDKLITKSMRSILRKMDLDPENVVWTSSYHTNTDNPHCHINFYEKKQTKRKQVLSKHQIEHLRSSIASEMKINTLLFVKRDDAMANLMNSLSEMGFTKEMMRNYEDMIQRSNSSQKGLDQIYKKLLALNDVLPEKGSMKYNSKNIRPFHNQIRDVIKDIYELDGIKPFVDEYRNILKETQEMQQELYGTGNDGYEDEFGTIVHGQGNDEKRQDEYYRRKMYDLETRLGNLILQTIVDGRKDVDKIEKDQKKLNDLENKKTTLDWKTNSKKQTKEYTVNRSHGDKSKKSMKRNSRKRITKSVFHRRSNMICHATVSDMSNAIQTAYYANLDIKQKVQEATRNAQREAYARQMY